MSLGPVVTMTDVRRRLQASLQTWLPSTIDALGKRLNEGMPANGQLYVPQPRAWSRLPDTALLRVTADQAPLVAVVGGPSDETHRDGDGVYSTTWLPDVYVVVRGDTFEETWDLLGLYLGAVRVAAVQHDIGLAGARRPRYLREVMRELDTDASRSLAFGVVHLAITVGNVMDDSLGPLEPPAAPDYEESDDVIAEEATFEIAPFDEVEA